MCFLPNMMMYSSRLIWLCLAMPPISLNKTILAAIKTCFDNFTIMMKNRIRISRSGHKFWCNRFCTNPSISDIKQVEAPANILKTYNLPLDADEGASPLSLDHWTLPASILFQASNLGLYYIARQNTTCTWKGNLSFEVLANFTRRSKIIQNGIQHNKMGFCFTCNGKSQSQLNCQYKKVWYLFEDNVSLIDTRVVSIMVYENFWVGYCFLFLFFISFVLILFFSFGGLYLLNICQIIITGVITRQKILSTLKYHI